MNRRQLEFLRAQQQALAEQAKPLVEFKAGLLTQTGTRVTADPRRGTLRLMQRQGGVLHLEWIQRPGGRLESQNDVVLMPSSATWERVSECTTGRVYLLRFHSGRKIFYWMQEEKDDKDAEYARKINRYIRNPPAGVGLSSALEGAAAGATPGASQQEQLQQLLMQSFQSMVQQNAGGDGAAAGTANQQALLQQQTQLQASSLPVLLDPDRVIPLFENDEKAREALYEYLPEDQRNPDQFRKNLRSPQLRQALLRLSAALNSDQFQTVMASFGLQPGSGFGTRAFLDAIEERVEKEEEEERKEQDKDKDKEGEEMDTSQ